MIKKIIVPQEILGRLQGELMTDTMFEEQLILYIIVDRPFWVRNFTLNSIHSLYLTLKACWQLIDT